MMGSMTGVRRALLASCAMAAMVSTGARAQTIPQAGALASGVKINIGLDGAPVSAVTGTGLSTPVLAVPTTTNDLRLEITQRNTVINWNSFDIAATRTSGPGVRSVTFAADLTAQTTPYAVLNRVTGGGGASQILGALRTDQTAGQPTGTIFLLNPNGVLFGASSTVDTGAFVASALDFVGGVGIGDDRQIAFNPVDPNALTFQLQGPLASSGTVTLLPGASLKTAGALVLVAPQLTSSGMVQSTGGDALLVAATDATVSFSAGSLVGVVVAKGTAVGGGALTVPAGSLSAGRVYAVAVPQADVVGALLNVGGAISATSVVSTEAGIVLAAGAGSGRLTVTAAAHVGGVTATGILLGGAGGSTIAATGDVAVAGTTATTLRDVTSTLDKIDLGTTTGLLAVTGTLNAAGDITLAAPGAISVQGAVISTGGGLSANSSADAVSFGSDVAVQTNVTVTSVKALSTLGVSATAGGVSLTSGTTLTNSGALTAQLDITLTAAQALSAGAITSNNGAFAATSSGASVSLTGDVLAKGTIGVSATTFASLAGLKSDAAITVLAGGPASVSGAVSASTDYAVTGAGVTLGAGVAQTAGGKATIVSTGTTDIVIGDGASLGSGTGRLVLDSSGSITGSGATFAGGAGQDVRVRAAGTIALGTITGRALTGIGATYDTVTTDLVTGGDLLLGTVTVAQPLVLHSTGGRIAAKSLTSTKGGVSVEGHTAGLGLATVDVGTISASGPIAATADTGNAHVGTASTSVGTITVTAAAFANVGNASATAPSDIVVSGGSANLDHGTGANISVVGASGPATLGQVGATGNILVDAGPGAASAGTLGLITATGDIRVHGGLADLLNGTGANIAVVSTAGPAVLRKATATAGILVDAGTGAASAGIEGDVTATNDITVVGGSVLTGHALQAGDDIALVATGPAVVGQPADVTVGGTLVTTALGVDDEVGNDALRATRDGGVAINDPLGGFVTGLGDHAIVLRAAGNVALNGDVHAAGALNIGALGAVSFAAFTTTQADAAVAVVAKGGDITLDSGTTLSANADMQVTRARPEGLTLTASGGIAGAGATVQALHHSLATPLLAAAIQPDVTLSTGGAVALGTLSGGAVAVMAGGSANIDALTAVRDVTVVAGDFARVGALRVSNLGVALGSPAANVSITATTISLGSARGEDGGLLGSVSLTAGSGGAPTPDGCAIGFVCVPGLGDGLPDIDSEGDILIRAQRGVTVAVLAASGSVPGTLGTIDIATTAGDAHITDARARQDILVNAAGGLAQLGSGVAGHDITLSGKTADATLLFAGDSVVVLATGGAATVGSAEVAGRQLLASIDPGTLDPAAPVTALFGSTAPSVTAPGSISVTSATADATLTSGTAWRDVTVSAPMGTATLGTGLAGHAVAVVGVTATATGLHAGDTVLVQATADATLGMGETTGQALTADLAGFDAANAADGSSRDILIAAGGQATATGALSAARDLSVLGVGGVTLGTVGATVTQSANDRVRIETDLTAGTAPTIALLGQLRLVSNADGTGAATARADGIGSSEDLVLRGGQFSIAGAGAALLATRSPAETLANQGTIGVIGTASPGATSIMLATVDSARVDLRARDLVQVDTLIANGSAVLATTGATGVTTLGSARFVAAGGGDPDAVPLMTASERASADLGLYGGTSVTLGLTEPTSDGLIRDVVLVANGSATITGRVAVSDDVVVVVQSGPASVNIVRIVAPLTVDPANDAQGGSDTAQLADPRGGFVIDPATSTALVGLAGGNIRIASGGAATLIDGMARRDVNVFSHGDATVGTGTAQMRDVTITASGNASLTTTTAQRNILLSTGGNATLDTSTATTGNVAVGSGGAAMLGTTTAGSTIAVTSGGDATLDTSTAGQDVDVTAKGIAKLTAVTANNLTLQAAGGPSATTSTTAVSIGGANLIGALTVTALADPSDPTKGGRAINLSGPAGVSAIGITLTGADLAILGAVSTKVANVGTIQINVGSGTDPVGVNTAATASLLDQGELNRITTGNLNIDAGGREVRFADPISRDKPVPTTTTIRAGTASHSFTVTTSGAIDIYGPLIARDTSALTLDATTATPPEPAPTSAPFAAPGTIRVVAGSGAADGGSIDVGTNALVLKANRIVVGELAAGMDPKTAGNFVGAILDANLTRDQVAANFVKNASSTLYNAAPPYPGTNPSYALITADTLDISAKDYALVQNTNTQTSPGGGIVVNTLKLHALPGADAQGPLVSVFGSLFNQTGPAAAVVPLAHLVLDPTISPTSVRVNGCVAGQGSGCIVNLNTTPQLNLINPASALLIVNPPADALTIDLVSGAANEALWLGDVTQDEREPTAKAAAKNVRKNK
jgi:fibronectin-binding autotransporter adhesin